MKGMGNLFGSFAGNVLYGVLANRTILFNGGFDGIATMEKSCDYAIILREWIATSNEVILKTLDLY